MIGVNDPDLTTRVARNGRYDTDHTKLTMRCESHEIDHTLRYESQGNGFYDVGNTQSTQYDTDNAIWIKRRGSYDTRRGPSNRLGEMVCIVWNVARDMDHAIWIVWHGSNDAVHWMRIRRCGSDDAGEMTQRAEGSRSLWQAVPLARGEFSPARDGQQVAAARRRWLSAAGSGTRRRGHRRAASGV